MNLAPIVPIANLADVEDFKYQMCLTYMCHQSKTYLEHYKRLAADGEHYVILDNSVHEMRVPDNIGRVLSLVREIRPQEVVLPDHINDAQATVDAAELAKGLLPSWVNVMAVPQGANFTNWTWCLEKLISLGINCIGLTRYSWLGDITRVDLIKHKLSTYGLLPPVHLLGWGWNDDFDLGVSFRSVDTAKVATLSVCNCASGPSCLYVYDTEVKPPRPKQFFELTSIKPVLLKYNCKAMQAGLKGAAIYGRA